MAAMDAEILQNFFGAFAPRFPTPREGRPWVFEIVFGGFGRGQFQEAPQWNHCRFFSEDPAGGNGS